MPKLEFRSRFNKSMIQSATGSRRHFVCVCFQAYVYTGLDVKYKYNAAVAGAFEGFSSFRFTTAEM